MNIQKYILIFQIKKVTNEAEKFVEQKVKSITQYQGMKLSSMLSYFKENMAKEYLFFYYELFFLINI